MKAVLTLSIMMLVAICLNGFVYSQTGRCGSPNPETLTSANASSANSLYDNGTSYKEVYSEQSSQVKAEYNYWGESPPDFGRFYGNVDYNPYRSTDPNDDPHEIEKPLAKVPDPSPSDQSYTQSLPSNADAQKIFYEGYLLEADEKYDEALDNFKTVISNYPESFEAMMALSRVGICLEQPERLNEFESYLNTIYQPNKNHLLGGKVLEMQIPVLVNNKSYNEALAKCATIIKNFPKSVMAKDALFNMWMIYFNDIDDLGAAKTTMDQFGSEYGNDEDHIFMMLAMGEINAEEVEDLIKSLSKSLASNSENELPVSFELSDNYPNPFNPETKIQIGLPKDSDVRLQIFNIRGQKVATLFEGNLPAGSHTVNFDASSLPSGVYFYKIVAGEFTDVKRMVLVK